jgi:ketosteroid isomerase-like protein
MSVDADPDLVAIGRRLIEADSYDEWAALAERYFAPDIVWDTYGGIGPFEGRDAILAFIKEYWMMWDTHQHHAEQVLDLGHGVAFWAVREDGRIKGSGAQVETRRAWVSRWVEGRIVRQTAYDDPVEARAAAERLAQERE